MQMSDEKTFSVQTCLKFRFVGQGLWICIFFPDIRSEADLRNWQYDSCVAENCLIFDQIKQTLVQNVASLFLGSQVVLFGGERGMPFVVGDVGELERGKTKS